MMPPEMVTAPTSMLAARSGAGASDGVLRTELLHRHLSARVAAARETLEILEARDPSADDRLVARFSGLVAEAQQVLAREKADAAAADAARLLAAEARAARLLADAEGEARLLRSVATWLDQAPVGAEAERELAPAAGAHADAAGDDDVTLDVRDGAVLDLAEPRAEAPAP
jgi:hypothetical protein